MYLITKSQKHEAKPDNFRVPLWHIGYIKVGYLAMDLPETFVTSISLSWDLFLPQIWSSFTFVWYTLE